MSLVVLDQVSFAYSSPKLLDNVTLRIEAGERVGLVGRNGEGKSTLLKLIRGQLQPDDGTVRIAPGVRWAELRQDVPAGEGVLVFQIAAEGLGDLADAVSTLRTSQLAPETVTAQALEAAQSRIADAGAWDLEDRVDSVLREMQLDPHADFSSLSAGLKRRVLLARAMVSRPELLLLDEPTNHLDIDAIVWLENWLARFSGTLLFITHDRAFLQRMARRILELDRGRLFDWTCDYSTFLQRRDQQLEAERIANEKFDKKLAEEEVWIRQGIKARRTRNEGRVRALKRLREERSQRRSRQGQAKMTLQTEEKSGRVVAKMEGVSHSYDGERDVILGLTATVYRGDRIGIIGPNGAGKSTLLKILLGQLTPSEGTVKTGTNLSVAWFDQLREQLDDEKTPRQSLGEGTDFIEINGNRRHVMGYLKDFLFNADRAQTKIGFLSGGERNRLLLARILSRPCNVLVLDEPTNDLDAETLDLLEELLGEFSGTLLLVSHDRAFLNNVVTSTLVFEEQARVREYDGGYDDWMRQRPDPVREDAAIDLKETSDAPPSPPAPETSPTKPRKKLSYKDQRELEALPDRIEQLEQRQAELHERLADPDLYQKSGDEIAAVRSEADAVEEELLAALERWEELEDA